MKDLDFDEIDRAVNSVISNGSSSDGDANNQPNNPASAISQSDSQVVTPVGTPKPLVVRRSSGQFMDVVHPSSDMRRTIEVPERPSATTSMIAPTESSEIQSSLHSEPNEDASLGIDKSTVGSYEDANIDKISDNISNTLDKTSDVSLESPFISGTKVEKRPLGAFSADSISETSEQPDSDNQTDFAPQPSIDQNTMKNPGQAPMPAELQNDLLKIEADSSTTPEAVDIPETPVPTETTENSVDSEKPSAVEVTEPPSPISESPRDVAEKAAPTGPISIVQQYTEKPNSGDQNSGAIYDTSSYHKILAHPAKNKSGWMWVLYIAILLVVGAGVGAAVFYLVIPALNSL